MVKRLHLLIVIFTLVATLTTMAGIASAQRVYTFDFEYAKIWINPDGTIDLFYNVSFNSFMYILILVRSKFIQILLLYSF